MRLGAGQVWRLYSLFSSVDSFRTVFESIVLVIMMMMMMMVMMVMMVMMMMLMVMMMMMNNARLNTKE